VRIDMNRDHLLLRTSEARAIALVAREYQPDVVIDAHEFTVLDRWVAKFGGAMSYDALIQYATVGNLAPALTSEADARFRTAILAALDGARLKAHWFCNRAGSNDRTVSMGGRWTHGATSWPAQRGGLPAETRGVSIGRAHFKRRVRARTDDGRCCAPRGVSAEVLALT
jgi:hypothetical protein